MSNFYFCYYCLVISASKTIALFELSRCLGQHSLFYRFMLCSNCSK